MEDIVNDMVLRSLNKEKMDDIHLHLFNDNEFDTYNHIKFDVLLSFPTRNLMEMKLMYNNQTFTNTFDLSSFDVNHSFNCVDELPVISKDCRKQLTHIIISKNPQMHNDIQKFIVESTFGPQNSEYLFDKPYDSYESDIIALRVIENYCDDSFFHYFLMQRYYSLSNNGLIVDFDVCLSNLICETIIINKNGWYSPMLKGFLIRESLLRNDMASMVKLIARSSCCYKYCRFLISSDDFGEDDMSLDFYKGMTNEDNQVILNFGELNLLTNTFYDMWLNVTNSDLTTIRNFLAQEVNYDQCKKVVMGEDSDDNVTVIQGTNSETQECRRVFEELCKYIKQLSDEFVKTGQVNLPWDYENHCPTI